METTTPEQLSPSPTEASRGFMSNWKDTLFKIGIIATAHTATLAGAFESYKQFSQGDTNSAILYGLASGTTAVVSHLTGTSIGRN